MIDLVRKYKEVPETVVFGIVCLYFMKTVQQKTSGEIYNGVQIYEIEWLW